MRFPFFNKRESAKDLKRGQGRVVFLGKSKKYSEWSSRIFEFTKLHPIELGVLFVAAFLIYSFTARGSALVFHPATCAGGWQNAQNAQGVPEVSTGADLVEFTPANSALFIGGVQSIDCSSFSGIQAPEGTAIEALSLSFSLGVKKVSISANPEGENPAPIDGGVQLILNPDGSSSSSPTDSQSTTSNEPIILPEQSVTPAPTEASIGEPILVTPAETPAEQPAPVAPSVPVENGPQSSWFVPVALAQEVASTSESDVQSIDIVQSSLPLGRVSYSFDGSVWYDLGTFDEKNFANLVYQIPVLQTSVVTEASSTAHGPEILSWADLSSLRVRIDSDVLTLDTRYEVYLDGVSLEASYTDAPQVTETQLVSVASTDSAPSDSVASTTQVIETQQPVTLLPEQLPLIEPSTSVLGEGAKRVLNLLRSRIVPAMSDLPWQDEDVRARVRRLGGESVRVNDSGDDVVLSGSCSEDYYVVLIFKNADDYIKHPGRSLYNSASVCTGSFTVDVNSSLNVLSRLSNGTYYVLVASQTEGGSWIPISSVVPFVVE